MADFISQFEVGPLVMDRSLPSGLVYGGVERDEYALHLDFWQKTLSNQEVAYVTLACSHEASRGRSGNRAPSPKFHADMVRDFAHIHGLISFRKLYIDTTDVAEDAVKAAILEFIGVCQLSEN